MTAIDYIDIDDPEKTTSRYTRCFFDGYTDALRSGYGQLPRCSLASGDSDNLLFLENLILFDGCSFQMVG